MFRQRELTEFDHSLNRDHLIASVRILFVDDEHPILLDELSNAGFAVDHDQTGNDTRKIDSQIYDVIILDYYGVGQRLGNSQGLSLLKHIRRVSPRSRVIAYTSKTLSASESEFFRNSHVVLPKDFGLADSLALVEDQARIALSKDHLFQALIEQLQIADPETKAKARQALTRALKRKDDAVFRSFIVKVSGAAAEKAVDILLHKLFPRF
jgi:DNA-binding NtrC family response regulator